MDHGAEQEALGQVKSQSILIHKNYIKGKQGLNKWLP